MVEEKALVPLEEQTVNFYLLLVFIHLYPREILIFLILQYILLNLLYDHV